VYELLVVALFTCINAQCSCTPPPLPPPPHPHPLMQPHKCVSQNLMRYERGTRDSTLPAPEEYMAYGHNRYAAFNQIFLHLAPNTTAFP
jgi:hypothetical protein